MIITIQRGKEEKIPYLLFLYNINFQKQSHLDQHVQHHKLSKYKVGKPTPKWIHS